MSDLFSTVCQPPTRVFAPADGVSEGCPAISVRTGAIRRGARTTPEATCRDAEELDFKFLDSETNYERSESIRERSEFKSERSEFAEERPRTAGTKSHTIPKGPMLAALDVYYRNEPPSATAACVGFTDWADEKPTFETRIETPIAGEYKPREFYRRELPPLLALLEGHAVQPDVVILDGYVWLGDLDHPGLGARLHQALGGRCAIVGVAKNPLRGAGPLQAIRRGESQRPLFVSAAGIDLAEAAELVRTMHGPFRTPTLLRRVDRVSRE